MFRWTLLGLAAVLCCLAAARPAAARPAAARPAAARPAHAGDKEDDKVNKLIRQFLEDKDVKKRRLALLDLEIVGTRVKGVLQALQIGLEKDPEPVVRREVAACLARMGEDAKEAIPDLAQALRKDKDDKTRELAGRALLQMVPYCKKAMTQLTDALGDPYPPVRAAVAETLKELGEHSKPAVPKLLEFLQAGKDKKAGALARMHAALALGRIGIEGPTCTPVLATVLADDEEDPLVRESAADSLGRFGVDARAGAKALAQVVMSTKTESAIKFAAVKALGKVNGQANIVWPALKSALGDSNANLRVLAIRASEQYGTEEPETVKTLANLARNDESVEVRLAAIQVLGLIGPAAKGAEKDLRFLEENDSSETVRDYAKAALKKILDAP